jgi:hypothetical protein
VHSVKGAVVSASGRNGGALDGLCYLRLSFLNTSPHAVSQKELRAAFNPSTGWSVAAIAPERIQTRFHDDHGAPAWFATIKRI